MILFNVYKRIIWQFVFLADNCRSLVTQRRDKCKVTFCNSLEGQQWQAGLDYKLMPAARQANVTPSVWVSISQQQQPV